jgi:glycerol-3-phosphate dehydrogenase
VAAWSEAEEAELPRIAAKAHQNGVAEVCLISRDEVLRREPHLSLSVRAAVLVPGEQVIDPWSAPLAYAHQALAHGARIWRQAEVTAGQRDGDAWRLTTARGEVRARVVVNASGNFGDRVEEFARPSPFRIRPRKGQFVVFDKEAATKLTAILLPVPTERTKGVVLFRTIFGNLAIGPTAEDQDDRDNAACDTETLLRLKARAIEMLPALEGVGVNAIYAGLRPASDRKDYVIECLADRHWITVGGIRSTGLTAALGIARHVADLHARAFGGLGETEPIWTPVPSLAEHLPRPYEAGGEIVCHCERVTRGEIAAALTGPLPARSMAGLKRRTRATMGRCQGFYCSAHVAALLREAQHGEA